jgi:hypothetical protein
VTGTWVPWPEDGAATVSEHHREFLAGVHVGTLQFDVAGDECRSPVWCRCEEGVVMIALSSSAAYDEIERVAWATLEICDDAPPFGRLVLEGPLTVERGAEVVLAGLRPQRWRRA